MSALSRRPDQTHPIWSVEDQVNAVADRLALVNEILESNPEGVSLDILKGLDRIVSEALHDAQAVRDAWYAREAGSRS